VAVVETDSQLARALGVTRQAIWKAARAGRIERAVDGSWDVFIVVESWRANTVFTLRRPWQTREFCPWLDPAVALESPSVWGELWRRAEAVGADIYEADDDA
jgi:hypothetical protein